LKAENTAVEIRHADHVAPSIRKQLARTSLTSGGRSVDIVRLRTEAMEFLLLFLGKRLLSHDFKHILCLFRHHFKYI
jgi:hypothetical protein